MRAAHGIAMPRLSREGERRYAKLIDRRLVVGARWAGQYLLIDLFVPAKVC